LALAMTWTPNLSQYFIRRKNEENRAPDETTPTDISETASSEDQDETQKLLAAEEKHVGGFFHRVIKFHEHWLRRALEKPRLLILFSIALVVIALVCFNFTDTDLLPEMDEGGFVIDYIMPAGSSLAETNRVIAHIEEMLREVKEVESTSRRTGLQLGLA